MLNLNNKQRKVLEAIFERPTRRNLAWTDIERLLLALGADRIEKGGSMVAFRLNDVREVFHRPHPQKEAKAYAVVNVRMFLEKAGVKL